MQPFSCRSIDEADNIFLRVFVNNNVHGWDSPGLHSFWLLPTNSFQPTSAAICNRFVGKLDQPRTRFALLCKVYFCTFNCGLYCQKYIKSAQLFRRQIMKQNGCILLPDRVAKNDQALKIEMDAGQGNFNFSCNRCCFQPIFKLFCLATFCFLGVRQGV